MKNAMLPMLLATLTLAASLVAAPNPHCSRLTTVRFERARVDRNVTLVVYYDGERAELPLMGRPAEYVLCPDVFVLASEDDSKRVSVRIDPDHYFVDAFGTIHVIVRAADLDGK